VRRLPANRHKSFNENSPRREQGMKMILTGRVTLFAESHPCISNRSQPYS
jgi:hypothetical protein